MLGKAAGLNESDAEDDDDDEDVSVADNNSFLILTKYTVELV